MTKASGGPLSSFFDMHEQKVWVEGILAAQAAGGREEKSEL